MNHLLEIGIATSAPDYANFCFELSTWELALFRATMLLEV
jgi:hypothetical protein